VITGVENMNRDEIKGKWMQYRGIVQEKWGKLTEDDLDVIDGQVDQLAGKIQERYGIARKEAQRQVKEFERTLPEDPARRAVR
jgi:uncharacterized protein YjbJ (UPF0337 family)